MTISTLGRRMLAAGLLAASVAGSTGTAAHASGTPVPIQTRTAGTADVLIDGKNFDLGSETSTKGHPDGAATLDWLLENGKLKPQVDGYITIKGALGSCAYIRLTYLDAAGTDIGHADSDQPCATTSKSQPFHEFAGGLSSDASTDIASVEVKLVKVTASHGETTVGKQTIPFGPFVDDVQLVSGDVAFGDGGLDPTGNPLGSGTLSWTYDQGPVAHLEGELYQSIPLACARMHLFLKDAAGNVIAGADKHGNQVCASTTPPQTGSIDLSVDGALNAVSVDVVLEAQQTNGKWVGVATQSSTFSTLVVPGL